MKKYLKFALVAVTAIGLLLLLAPYVISQAVKTGITNEKSWEIDRSEAVSEEKSVDAEIDSYFSEEGSWKTGK